MNEKLLQNPKKRFTLKHDQDCKTILIELGIAAKFSVRSPKEGEIPVQSVSHLNHPTHWIHAIRISDNENPAEDAHLIFCIPKCEIDVKGFMASMEKFMREHFEFDEMRIHTQDTFNN